MIKYDIKKRRVELGLTLEEVAKAVGVGRGTVYKWESGQIENMKRDKIPLLAKTLKLTVAELLCWDSGGLSDKDRRRAELYANAKASDDPVLKGLVNAIDKLLGIDEP